MSKYNIVITELAEKDLLEIGYYISYELLEPDIALKVVNNIGERILTLEDMPLRNALVADERLALRGIRNLLVDNFIVFYVVLEKSDTVTVVRILYGKREWENLL
jgi:addiction module RelE/StbE family toxin